MTGTYVCESVIVCVALYVACLALNVDVENLEFRVQVFIRRLFVLQLTLQPHSSRLCVCSRERERGGGGGRESEIYS